MNRILVTGGAGFLGSHLCERLLEAGNHVICFDNLFTGSHQNLRGCSTYERHAEHRFEFVRGDVCEPFHFEVDQIYNLACPASPLHYQRNPTRTIETCVLGTRNALRLGREAGARVLIASTSEIYGDPEVHPQIESYVGHVNTLGPRACYDEGKRCAEAMASSYSRQYGTQVRIARIFNCYGPRMAIGDGRVVSNFIVQALRGQPLTVYGDGSQTRSFIYVDDLIDGLIRLMGLDGPSTAVLPVNLGNPGEFTITELADKVQGLVKRVGIDRRPAAIDDPTRRRPDIARAQKLLDWNPRVKLDDGLVETVSYFRSILSL